MLQTILLGCFSSFGLLYFLKKMDIGPHLPRTILYKLRCLRILWESRTMARMYMYCSSWPFLRRRSIGFWLAAAEDAVGYLEKGPICTCAGLKTYLCRASKPPTKRRSTILGVFCEVTPNLPESEDLGASGQYCLETQWRQLWEGPRLLGSDY